MLSSPIFCPLKKPRRGAFVPGAASPFAVPEEASTIAGYSTLAAASIRIDDLPAELSRKLPRYPVVPVALIGRLAVDRRYAGRSLGSVLLYDAAGRAMRADPAIFALVVDAKDSVLLRITIVGNITVPGQDRMDNLLKVDS
jgi:hypothetical protein